MITIHESPVNENHYSIETIVVAADMQRFGHFSPRAALMFLKENNGTMFLRNKEMKIEEQIKYIGGELVRIRIKHNHKIVEDIDDLPVKVLLVLDIFDEAMGLWEH